MATLSEKLKQVRATTSPSSFNIGGFSTGSLTDKLKQVRDNVIPPVSEFQKLQDKFKPQVSLSDKLKEVRKQSEPSFGEKVVDFVNPFQKTNVRPALAKDEQEIYGGKVIGGIANLASRIVEDIFVGGVKTYSTLKKAKADSKGEKYEPVKLPFDVSFQPDFNGEVKTQNEFVDYSTDALNRINELDKERPDKPFLNLLQGATERIFFPVLDSVDIIGAGELVTRGARKIVTNKKAADAFAKLGITAFGDTSDTGIKTAVKNKADSILKRVADGKITEKEGIKQIDELGNALDILAESDKFRFGKTGEKIFNFAESLTKDRTIKEGIEQLRNTPLGLSIKAVDDVADEGKTVFKLSTKQIDELPALDKQDYTDFLKKKLDDIGQVADDEQVVIYGGNGAKGQYVDTDIGVALNRGVNAETNVKVVPKSLLDEPADALKVERGERIFNDDIKNVSENLRTSKGKVIPIRDEKGQFRGSIGRQGDELFGGVAGIEVDENGNIDFDATKAALGVAGLGTIKGFNAGRKLPVNTLNLQAEAKKFKTSKAFLERIKPLFKISAKSDIPQADKTLINELANLRDSFKADEITGAIEKGQYKSLTDASDRILEDFYKASKGTTDKASKVVSKTEKGTAPASKVDDLRTALTSPDKVVDEAVKTQRRVSGTEPDGVLTAAKQYDQAKEIKNTPAKASRYSMKNTKAPIEIPDETRLGWLQRKIQDKFNRLKMIQAKIAEKTGLPISDDLNAYLQQEMFHGRAAERLDKFESAIISTKGQKGQKALLQRMADDGISIDEMGEYLHAKHAASRNARVAKINPDIPDGGSGLTNAQAEKILKKFDAEKTAKLEDYRKEFKEKVIDARLKILEEEHLLKPEAVENIARAFDDDTYVPLKVTSKPDVRLRGGKGFDVRGKDVKSLKGSTRADRNNPVVQAIVDYEDAVIKAEKNKVGRTMKKIVEQNPDVVNAQGEKLWDIKAQQYAPQYNKFGEVEYVKPVGFKLDDNVMEVRDRGKIYHITFNDPALASAMKNLGTERGVKFLHQINNYLRSVITFYNPEFMITNFERDIQTALVNTAGEQGLKQSGQVAKDVAPALKGIWRNVRGKSGKVAKSGVDWTKEYEELKSVGGRVGWFDYNTVAEKQAKIQSRINRASGKKATDRAAATWDAIAEYVSDVNESVESGVRLSAYVNAKKAGMTKEQAASLAKNLTVNFNKKGEWGSAMNSLYLFANAGIQGTARIFSALKHKRTRRIVAGISAFAYGVNYMNEQINKEGYDKISDWEKNTNLIFMLPEEIDAKDIPFIPDFLGSVVELAEGEKYIKIKLPYGYNVFKALGDTAYDMSLGNKRVGDSIKRMVFAMDESFNPLSSGSAAQLVSPTISDPIVQMYENKNFFGSPIKPSQSPYGAKVKESDLYFSGVRRSSKAFTDWINGVTGGNDVEAGLVDISPENVDHIIDFLGGGVSKFIANTVDTGVNLVKGDLPEVNNVPFVRKFVGEVYKDVEKSLFYDLLDKSETRLLNENELANLKKYGKEALDEGQFDKEQATKAVTTFKSNQGRIHAGRILDKMKDTVVPDERREIYNTYIQENNLGTMQETILKEFKSLTKEISTKEAKLDKANTNERGFIGTLIDGGRGLFIDPENVMKAVFTEEKLGKVEGNLVELQRFYGLDFNEQGGSQEKKRELMEAQGLNWSQAKDYKLEHITPVKAGGDTSDKNLKIVSNEEHDAYTPIDIVVINAVQSGTITRKEATDLMTRLKINKSITAQELYDEIKAKAK